MTRLLGVIGDPIAHSLSPLIHNGWFRDLHIDATYEALHVPAGTLQEALRALAKRHVHGVNITLPHKHDALALSSEASEAAIKIGAANTLTYLGENRWCADNTDAPGFMIALGETEPTSRKALILGAGGSSRAVVYAMVKAGFAVTILNRTEEKAGALARELGNSETGYGSINLYKDYTESATILINTTSMGHAGHILELPEGKGRKFIDISYGGASQSQLAHAQAMGWVTTDGLDMLVAQAALSFEIWFGAKPDSAAAHRRCRTALAAVS